MLAEARERRAAGHHRGHVAGGRALVDKYTDILQIGAHVQNYALLHAVGRTRTPVFLKRGLMSTVQEWLMSDEYILSGGNHQVMLCERGIRTFETATRFTLDLNAIPLLKQLTHRRSSAIPVMAQANGNWSRLRARRASPPAPTA
jgi:3-deoxy-7-phosphoheptulonate synthase